MPDAAMPEAEQSFRATPGEALTNSHSSGTKDMQLYGTVEVETVEESESAAERFFRIPAESEMVY